MENFDNNYSNEQNHDIHGVMIQEYVHMSIIITLLIYEMRK